MGCSICASLERDYLVRLGEYIEARSSVGFRFSTKLAAQANVEMERARYELEEHRSVCTVALAFPVHVPPIPIAAHSASATLRPVAA
jgi:hypothetical protein